MRKQRQQSLRVDPSPPPRPVSHGMIWFDDELRWDQPERYAMNMARIRAWERVREESAHRRWSDKSTIRMITNEQVKKGLVNAVKDMNNWLFKGEMGDHPNNVFVNFLKKSLGKEAGGIHMLDRDTKCGLSPNSVLVTVKDKAVVDLHFYMTNWPDYGLPLLQKIREESAKLNFKELRGEDKKESITIKVGLGNTLDGFIDAISNFKVKA